MEAAMRRQERARHRERIEQLIASSSQDPERQATLMVLSSVNSALEDVADEMVTKSDFAAHEVDEIKILTGIKWAWWSATSMGAAVLLLGGYIYLNGENERRGDSVLLRTVAQTQQVGLSRLTALELWRAATESGTEQRRADVDARLREFDARLRSVGK